MNTTNAINQEIADNLQRYLNTYKKRRNEHAAQRMEFYNSVSLDNDNDGIFSNRIYNENELGLNESIDQEYTTPSLKRTEREFKRRKMLRPNEQEIERAAASLDVLLNELRMPSKKYQY